MRSLRRVAIIAAVASFAACMNSDTTAPQIDDGSPVFMDGSAIGVVAASGGATGATAMVPPLPAELKLSDAQRAQITQLVSAFQDATKADMTALGGLQHQADEARKAGKGEADIRAILSQGIAIRARLDAAQNKLRTDIEAVLTPAQLAWVRAHAPKPCTPGAMLTQAQQAQIHTLVQAFEQANRADLTTVAAVMDQARTAKKAGKSDTEIRAILQTAAAAQARLETAHKALQAQIEAVLTPDQKASGCFTHGP